MTTAIFIQARMGANRLPGKPLFKVLGRTLLSYLIERLKRAVSVDTIYVLTSDNPRDNLIEKEANVLGIPVFRGSEEDVLSRFYLAAMQFKPTTIVRITADCPLIDPQIIDELICLYKSQDSDFAYVSNAIHRTYPRGMDAEVFSFKALEEAYQQANKPYEHEHVTPYLYTHPEKFTQIQLTQKNDHSSWRWTVDTPEDFMLVSKLLSALYPQKPDFNLTDLTECYLNHPEWHKINQHIPQKSLPLEAKP